MIEGPIVQDQVFKHTRTGCHYIVMNGNSNGDADTKTILKVGKAGPKEGWVHAIVYYDPTEPNSMFVRDEETFRSSFERV